MVVRPSIQVEVAEATYMVRYPNRTLAQFKELHADEVRGIASLTEDEYKYATQRRAASAACQREDAVFLTL